MSNWKIDRYRPAQCAGTPLRGGFAHGGWCDAPQVECLLPGNRPGAGPLLHFLAGGRFAPCCEQEGHASLAGRSPLCHCCCSDGRPAPPMRQRLESPCTVKSSGEENISTLWRSLVELVAKSVAPFLRSSALASLASCRSPSAHTAPVAATAGVVALPVPPFARYVPTWAIVGRLARPSPSMLPLGAHSLPTQPEGCGWCGQNRLSATLWLGLS